MGFGGRSGGFGGSSSGLGVGGSGLGGSGVCIFRVKDSVIAFVCTYIRCITFIFKFTDYSWLQISQRPLQKTMLTSILFCPVTSAFFILLFHCGPGNFMGHGLPVIITRTII